MQEIEYYHAVGDVKDAGYLRIKYSDMISAYCTDIIMVRVAFRRQGIASALLERAKADIGYIPAPEAILDNKTAPSFWNQKGFSTGFNQAYLDAE